MSQQGYGAFTVAGQFNISAPTPVSGQIVPLQLDSQGNLLVNVAVGGGGGGSNASVGLTGANVPTSATYVAADNPGGKLTGLAVDASGNLLVNVAAGGSSGAQFAMGSVQSSSALGTIALGYDGANVRGLLTDTTGQLKILVENTVPVTLTSTTITGTVAVTQSTSPWLVSQSGSPWGVIGTTADGSTTETNILVVGGESNDITAQYQPIPLGSAGRSVIIEGFAGGVAVPVSFTTTLGVTQSTSPWVVSLTSTTITGTVAVTQSTSPWVTNVTQWGSTNVVTGGTGGSVGVGGLAASGATPVGNPVSVGGFDSVSNVTRSISLNTDGVLFNYGKTALFFQADGVSSNNSFYETSGGLQIYQSTFGYLYNGTNWDRTRSVLVGNNIVGNGVAASGMYGQFNTTLPTLNSTNFSAIQVDSNGRLIVNSPSTVITNFPVNASGDIRVDASLSPISIRDSVGEDLYGTNNALNVHLAGNEILNLDGSGNLGVNVQTPIAISGVVSVQSSSTPLPPNAAQETGGNLSTISLQTSFNPQIPDLLKLILAQIQYQNIILASGMNVPLDDLDAVNSSLIQ